MSHNLNKITVIIPTYNREKTLPRAINSVLTQTYTNFELIISDDASTDNTHELIKNFMKKDQRIKYIRLNNNSGGAAKPKNEAIKKATGKFIAILDSDDEWLPIKLGKQIKIFQQKNNHKLGFVGCYALKIYEKENIKIKSKIPKYKNIFKNILIRDYMESGSSMIYKKKVFDKVGLFDENITTGQDWDIRIRLSQFFDFDFVPQILFKYYIHQNNISKKTKNIKKTTKYIYNKYKKYYIANPKIYSYKLTYDGTRYMIVNQFKLARKCFIKSIKINHFNIKNYILLFLSFSKFFYKIALIKNRLKNIFILFHPN